MNRQQRRHPNHPLVPSPHPSKKRILDHENPKTYTVAKGDFRRRIGKRKVV